MSDPEAKRNQVVSKEVLEVIAVFLLSVTAILTAWCGFQASRWSGERSIEFSQASAARIASSDFASQARDARSVDIAVYAQWIDARAAGDTALESYVQARFTPAFQIAFAAWQKKGENLKSPFAEPSYVPDGTVQARAQSKAADRLFASALQSNQHGDNYSLLTVLFALVLFFSAMSTRDKFPVAGWVLLGLAILIVITGCVILATYPVSI